MQDDGCVCRRGGWPLVVVRLVADAALHECPGGGGELRKVFSAPYIGFKGSGFYRTDNRKRRPSDVKVDAKADGKSDGKADTKVDAGSSSSSSSEGTSTAAKTESAAPAASAEDKGTAKPKAAEAKTA